MWLNCSILKHIAVQRRIYHWIQGSIIRCFFYNKKISVYKYYAWMLLDYLMPKRVTGSTSKILLYLWGIIQFFNYNFSMLCGLVVCWIVSWILLGSRLRLWIMNLNSSGSVAKISYTDTCSLFYFCRVWWNVVWEWSEWIYKPIYPNYTAVHLHHLVSNTGLWKDDEVSVAEHSFLFIWSDVLATQ